MTTSMRTRTRLIRRCFRCVESRWHGSYPVRCVADPGCIMVSQEMAALKSSLEAKSDLQVHREHLRTKLAMNFRKFCSANEVA
jgi:hypothetical protein